MSGTYSPSSKILLLFFAKLWLASVNKSLQKTQKKNWTFWLSIKKYLEKDKLKGIFSHNLKGEEISGLTNHFVIFQTLRC